MGISIDTEKCVACGGCAEACPGGLLELVGGSASIGRPADCWGCAACLKACPKGAISLRLPPALGGLGGSLSCRRDAGRLVWVYYPAFGEVLEIDGGGGEAGY
jgi:adenylylsulfate reductase subunit B